VTAARQDAGEEAVAAKLPVQPVRRAFEQVSDQLRELIGSGALGAGQRLPTEAELSVEFGVSRATVREALRLLSADDLVRTARGAGGGSYVTVPTLGRIAERLGLNLGVLSQTTEIGLDQLLEVRELIEVPAARLAARRHSKRDVDGLLDAIPAAASALSRDHQFAHNRDFHFRLVEASANPLLSLVSQPVFSVLQAHLRRSDQPAGDQEAIVEHHRQIVAAVEAGDEDAAAEETRHHLDLLRPGYERAWTAIES